jgi:small GTP-binding protein
MALFNYSTKEITIKVVYYGPGLSGKTTNLQYLHSVLEHDMKGKLLSLATEADRTLFFDFLPVNFGKIKDFSIRFQLYTVPGQVRYNATRKLVLKGADAIVFVADSQHEMRDQNIESIRNMKENLTANNINPDEIPIILQYNKRDLPNTMTIESLNNDLNENNRYPYLEAVATKGTGVNDTFQEITKLLIDNIAKKYGIKVAAASEEPAKPVQEAIVSASQVQSKPEATPVAWPSEDKQQPKEVVIREIREVPAMPVESLERIMNEIRGLSKSLQEINQNMSRALSEIREELREMKGTEKSAEEITQLLHEIREQFSNIKTKKSWFKFF